VNLDGEGSKKTDFQKLLVGIKESTNIGPQETKVCMKKVTRKK